MKRKAIPLLVVLTLVLFLSVPAMAAGYGGRNETGDNSEIRAGGQMRYVLDLSGLLTFNQWERLENRAAEISQRLGCGVYIITLDDYTDYGAGDALEVTSQIYHSPGSGFGVGEEENGITLLLSMDQRDWAMYVYGGQASYAFNSYGQEKLEAVFLDDLGEDDWYGGFSDYLDACEDYLIRAQEGRPVRQGPGGYIACSVLISFLIAMTVCLVLKGRMKTVKMQADAREYAVGRLELSEHYDRFTHITEVRRRIEKNDGGGSRGGSVSAGGSGRQGKF